MTARSLSNASRREAHAALAQPGDGGGEIIHPQADVVERRLVHARARLRIDGLHEIDLDIAAAQDVFVDVLALAAEGADLLEAQQIDPELGERALVGAADGDLLHAEHPEGAHGLRSSDPPLALRSSPRPRSV